MRRITTSSPSRSPPQARRALLPTWSVRSARAATTSRSTARCRSRRQAISAMTAVAYGAVQAGTYNTKPLVPEVLVKGDQAAVIRERIDVDALIAMDKPAPWL
jgi:hypothetical protein